MRLEWAIEENAMRRFLGLLLGMCAVLSGCAHAPPAMSPAALFDDARFAAPSQPVAPGELFALNEGMRRFVRTELPALQRRHGAQLGLVKALESRAGLKLEYDAQLTRTAAQAFDARAGNCLSLVLMTATFAKELGIPVSYGSAQGDDVWSRSHGLLLRSGHVNLTLGMPAQRGRASAGGTGYTIDFVPPEQASKLRTRSIDEETLVAMFMSNRAAESLQAGQTDDAYWFARAAVLNSPGHLDAYNTLGVVYLRAGHLAQAERVLAHVLRESPAHRPALANLSAVFDRTGRFTEAAALRLTLARLEPHAPYHYHDLGRAAMARGDAVGARDLFLRELARDGHHHESHFGLAQALLLLGDGSGARKHLALAADYSPSGGERAAYAAKLERLRSLQ